MYDAKNERHEFVAESREAAIAKAVDHFGVEAERLTVGGFATGEVYGLGARAVIVASLRDRTPPAPGRDRGDRGRDRGRDTGRGRDRDRDRGRGRDRDRDRGGRGGNRSEGRRDAVEAAPVSEVAPATATGPSIGTATAELGKIGNFVLGALERMDLGPFDIAETAEGDLLAYEVTGPAASALARGGGRAVDALQLLANQAVERRDGETLRVVIDIEGDAQGREDLLTGLATRAAGRASKSGRAVALDPMNGRDRRAIHLALRDEEAVATMSIGEGRYRQVVIVPEGAAEYERAVRESETARAGSED
jgi:spoIIIJ-associated protein